MDLSLISSFLKKLRKNNNRDWFQQNKSEYQVAMDTWLLLVEQLIHAIGAFDPEISLLDPKKCVFRIYRDVRFSKDKTPYKTNFSASMKPEGRKSPYGGYYLSFGPDETVLAAGIYHPERDLLAKIRQEIDYNPDPLLQLTDAKKFRQLFGEVEGEKLVRPPKGYEPTHPQIELLKHKDFIVYAREKQPMSSEQFLSWAVAGYQVAKPLNDYFNTVIRD